MRLSDLVIQDVRSFQLQHWEFRQPVSLIVGPNAAGKTTVLESIFLLASGESFRAGKIAEVIRFDQPLGRVQGKVVMGTGNNTQPPGIEALQLELTITPGQVAGRRTAMRLWSVNKVRRRRGEFVGRLLAVVFRPEDMRLIEGSPPRRRQHLDWQLGLASPAYGSSLHTYTQALKKYNRLLQAVREQQMPLAVLSFWEQQLVKHGQVLQAQRQRALEHSAQVSFPLEFSVRYVPSVISAARIDEYRARAIAAGHALIGPHKDDFEVWLDGHDVSLYGSRGQQRLAVLWLKLCELEYLMAERQDRPVLLLDDIFSELDDQSRHLVIEQLRHYQTIITTTDHQVALQLTQYQLDHEIITL